MPSTAFASQGVALTLATVAPAESQEFRPTSGATETTSAASLLIAAYVLMWLIIFATVLMTLRKQAALRSELDELEAAVRKPEAAPDSAA